MVDLERHSVVDVLDDRSVESAKAWLRERPTIEVVSRDRCGLYAQAARAGAPQARQVADRFHLVQNLREAIKEQMSVYGHAHVRPILSEDAIASARSQQRRARLAHRQSRQEIFDTLQALRQQGLTYSDCKADRIRAPQHRELAYFQCTSRQKSGGIESDIATVF